MATKDTNSRKRKLIDSYHTKCAKCSKWRYFDSQEEYEAIRSKSLNKCFECIDCEQPEVVSSSNWSCVCLMGGSRPIIMIRDIKSSSDVLRSQNGDATTDVKKSSNNASKNIEKEAGCKKPLELMVSANEVIIEEIKKGKLDGKVAVNGKRMDGLFQVSILYTGMLKDTETVFESNLGEAPLRFRLGGEKVIKGLSIGVEGMRVGDKRRLIIPPSLGYSEKGLKEGVPKNAWLIYEVEAVKVR